LHTKIEISTMKKYIETFRIHKLDSLSNSKSIHGGLAVHEINRNWFMCKSTCRAVP
jgi:hypothetical protein